MREANVTISDSEFGEMGIERLIALGREAGLQELEELACHGNGAVVQVTVGSRFDEDALEALDSVEEWNHVAEIEGGNVYVISFTAPNLPEDLNARVEDLIGTCDPVVTDDGADMSLVGPQEAISETMAEYRTAGVIPDLRRLGDYTGRADPLDPLTDRQQEVIQLAHGLGYYEVPRQISTGEIAAELDLDPSTVAEHLQRAERNLLSDLL